MCNGQREIYSSAPSDIPMEDDMKLIDLDSKIIILTTSDEGPSATSQEASF